MVRGVPAAAIGAAAAPTSAAVLWLLWMVAFGRLDLVSVGGLVFLVGAGLGVGCLLACRVARETGAALTVLAFTALALALVAWAAVGVRVGLVALEREPCTTEELCDNRPLCEALFGARGSLFDRCMDTEAAFDAVRTAVVPAVGAGVFALLGAGMLLAWALKPRQAAVLGAAAALAVPSLGFVGWSLRDPSTNGASVAGVHYTVTCHLRPGSGSFGWWVASGDGSQGGLMAETPGGEVRAVRARTGTGTAADTELVAELFGGCVRGLRARLEGATLVTLGALAAGALGAAALYNKPQQRPHRNVAPL